MAKMKVYVVQSYIIDDWETVNEQTLVYHFKENALRTLQDIRNQDFMPIVKEEDFAGLSLIYSFEVSVCSDRPVDRA